MLFLRPIIDGVWPGIAGDIPDLNIVLGNWNAGTSPIGRTNIPEPATAATLLLSVTAAY